MNGLLGDAGNTILEDHVDKNITKTSQNIQKLLGKHFLKKVNQMKSNGIDHSFQPDEGFKKPAEEFSKEVNQKFEYSLKAIEMMQKAFYQLKLDTRRKHKNVADFRHFFEVEIIDWMREMRHESKILEKRTNFST
jgi:hypothetical protein